MKILSLVYGKDVDDPDVLTFSFWWSGTSSQMKIAELNPNLHSHKQVYHLKQIRMTFRATLTSFTLPTFHLVCCFLVVPYISVMVTYYPVTSHVVRKPLRVGTT